MIQISTGTIVILLAVGYLGVNAIVKGVEKGVEQLFGKKDQEKK